jgi:hypothetical protein
MPTNPCHNELGDPRVRIDGGAPLPAVGDDRVDAHEWVESAAVDGPRQQRLLYRSKKAQVGASLRSPPTDCLFMGEGRGTPVFCIL